MPTNDLGDAVASYKERFGDSPPHYVFVEFDQKQAVDCMTDAIRVGRKLADRIPPDDVVV